MSTEATKAVLRRWYDEMWAAKNADLVPELAGPLYTRHEMGGTRTIDAEAYREQVRGLMDNAEISDMRYRLIAEGDRVCAVGSWKLDGKQWDWVQLFRVENGKLVETWLSGIGMESRWDPSCID
jgi:predicted SnoaL-like aldol condensation-catalyzing enzyme